MSRTKRAYLEVQMIKLLSLSTVSPSPFTLVETNYIHSAEER